VTDDPGHGVDNLTWPGGDGTGVPTPPGWVTTQREEGNLGAQPIGTIPATGKVEIAPDYWFETPGTRWCITARILRRRSCTSPSAAGVRSAMQSSVRAESPGSRALRTLSAVPWSAQCSEATFTE
jgi:hypothetical protein